MTTDLTVFMNEINEGAVKHFPELFHHRAFEQIEYEFNVFEKAGFLPALRFLRDVSSYCEKENILPGPGRGSMCGSSVFYSLGITKVNPLQWGLIFERFLNFETSEMPIIDIEAAPSRLNDLKERFSMEAESNSGFSTHYFPGDNEYREAESGIMPGAIVFIGNQVLDDLDRAYCSIYGNHVDPFKIISSFDDYKTLSVLRNGDTERVFGMDSESMQDLLKKCRPSTFQELVTVSAMNRPGPISSGMAEEYIHNKSNGYRGIHSVLEETCGILVFQEQIMNIANQSFGFSMVEADRFRKALVKSNNSEIEKFKAKALIGAEQKGLLEKEAMSLFDLLQSNSRFTFLKAHCVASTMISYAAAFIKANQREF